MSTRLAKHLAALEEVLVAKGKTLQGIANTTIVGSARETFVREFLHSHLGSAVDIGSGEIISAFKPREMTDRQQDVVVFDNRFPRLSLSTGLDTFLIESVHCTIEVKTTLTEDEYLKSARAAAELKHRWGMQTEAMRRQAPRRFVVAFAGPAKMATVLKWMESAYRKNVLQSQDMPMAEMYFEKPDALPRARHVSSSLDGIFVLGTGFILMDSFKFRFQGVQEAPGTLPDAKHFQYACAESDRGALACLFLALLDILDHVQLAQEYMPSFGGAPVTFHQMPRPDKI